MRKLFLLIFFVCFLFPRPVYAITKTLNPAADTTLNSNAFGANSNYGTGPQLRLNKSPLSQYMLLLKFDMSSIPVGQKITKATLKLYQESTSGDPVIVGASFDINKVTTAWKEQEVTWTTRPGRGAKADPSGNPNGIFAIQKTSGSYQSWIITPLVQEWVEGFEPNNGIYISMLVNGWSSILTSREGIHKPELIVEYTPVFKFEWPMFPFIPLVTLIPSPTSVPVVIPTVIPTDSVPIPTRFPTNSPESNGTEPTRSIDQHTNTTQDSVENDISSKANNVERLSMSDGTLVMVLKIGFIILLVLIILKFTVFK